MVDAVKMVTVVEVDIINIIQTIIAFLAFVLSIIALVISSKSQKKTIEESTKERHFSTLVELYRLGKTYTSNMQGFKFEINELLKKIEGQIDTKEFIIFYRSKKCDELRETISYFDFIQKMILDRSLSEEDCYNIITFPIELYKDMQPVIKYAKQRKIHDFDLFDDFCMNYINHMKESINGRK